MNKMVKRLLSVVLLFAFILQPFALSYESANNTNFLRLQVTEAAGNNSLPAATKDGVILHAWNWSFDTIRNRLPEIAAAGYKSIQTSPIQGVKENTMNGSHWWILYQPINFNIGNAQLGTREQFRQLCEEAANYGINIIVDVVANHTGNQGFHGPEAYMPATNVDPSIRNNPYFWHELRGITDWNDRWQVTQLGIGLPDLNTSNQELQDKIITFLNDAISLGADGFRFDAAKHIELPTDPSGGSNFWPRVLGSLNNSSNLYVYGEVLQGGADSYAQYANHMNVTASNYGKNVRQAIGFNSAKNVNQAYDFSAAGVAPSKLVTWVESHDTYANDGDETTNMNDWQIKMGWAVIAARANTVPLFFNRPAGSGKFAANLGTAGNNLWKDADVVAVNKFHNNMAGQSEYLRYQGNEIILVERGNKGLVIANLGGDAYIDQPTNLVNGVYTNKATGGGTFTVANGRITGNIGGGKLAVLYNDAASTQSFKVYYYKPDSWGTPNIYYYDESITPARQSGAWPGTAMANEGNGWYSHTLTGWGQARVIFNSNGQQMPAAQQAGYLVSGNAWIKDGVITSSQPVTMVNVTFTVRNATTVMGQNVFLVGNIPALGSWNTSQAVGPGSTSNYPNWSFNVSLPVGTTIEYKAIKKDSANNIIWESGNNRTYTVSSGNNQVAFDFRN